MKIFAFLAAMALAIGSFVSAAPAEAQRYGYNDGHRGYGQHRGYRNDRWRGDRRGWRGDRRGWRGDRRGWRGGYRARGRVVCRTRRGYYGPVRSCYRVYR